MSVTFVVELWNYLILYAVVIWERVCTSLILVALLDQIVELMTADLFTVRVVSRTFVLLCLSVIEEFAYFSYFKLVVKEKLFFSARLAGVEMNAVLKI